MARKAFYTKLKTDKQADKRVEKAYYASCSGIQVSLMDIPKVFAFGRTKVVAGEDDTTLAASIRAYVDNLNNH